MRAVEVREPGAKLKVVEREVPEPGPGKVRIKVDACGICYSDSFTVEATIPASATAMKLRGPISRRAGLVCQRLT